MMGYMKDDAFALYVIDKIRAADLYGNLQWQAPSASHCKSLYRSAANR